MSIVILVILNKNMFMLHKNSGHIGLKKIIKTDFIINIDILYFQS